MEHFRSGLFRRIILIHMIQALAFSVTGIIDGAVAGRFIGAAGLAGMKLAMPVFSVQYMIGGVISTGFAVQITRLLAKGKRDSANQCFMWVCTTAAAASAVFMLAGALFPDALTVFFAGKAAEAELLKDVRSYLIPIVLGSFPVIMHLILSNMALLEGDDRRLIASIAVVLVSDTVGDFIAVILGAGLKGLSIASVAAYFCACAVLSGKLFTGKSILKLCRPRFGEGMLAAVIALGSPVAVKYLCEFINPVAINRMMLAYGDMDALAALSIQDAAHNMPDALSAGISAGVLVLTGMYAAEYDSEALRSERKDIRNYCVKYGTVWALILFAAAPLLVSFFTSDKMLHGMGTFAFRWYLLGVPFMCLNEASGAYTQAMGKKSAASCLTVVNKLALPVIVTWILAGNFGVPGLFAAFAVHQMILTIILIITQLTGKRGAQRAYGEKKWKKIDAELRRDLMTVEQVTRASEDLILLCEENGVDSSQAFNMGLCLEELAANTIQHGYKDNREMYLEFRFVITGRWMILRLRDNGRTFDLTERYSMLDPDDPFSGIGLRLVFAAAEDVGYSRIFDMNNVCIRVLKQNRNHRLTD